MSKSPSPGLTKVAEADFPTEFGVFRIFGFEGPAADGAGQFVIAQVAIEAQLLVGFDGIGAAVLEFVGAQFVEQADAAALLELVDQQSAAGLGDAVEGDLQLRPAVAAQAVKDVPSEALRVDAHQRGRAIGEVTQLEHDGFLDACAVGGGGLKTEDPEDAELCGKVRFGHFREPRRRGFAHADCQEP